MSKQAILFIQQFSTFKKVANPYLLEIQALIHVLRHKSFNALGKSFCIRALQSDGNFGAARRSRTIF